MSQSPYVEPSQDMPPARKSNTPIVVIVLVVVLVVMLGCGGILLALLLPAVQAARQAARRMESSNNMKQIGLALHNYHSTYAALPPAYATDAAGNPTVSWRVLILPFMEEASLYDQFRLNEPWDSAHNIALLDQMPDFYRSPLAEESSTEANYFAIVDPAGIFRGPEQVRFRDIVDGTSQTVAVVEISNQGVEWSKPAELTTDSALQALQQLNQPGDAGHILLADGSVQYVDGQSLDPGMWRSLVTIDGND